MVGETSELWIPYRQPPNLPPSQICSRRAKHPGMCGLQNIGNTCYMAAGLQCLSNIPVFRDYFISGRFANDINRDNPLGWKGEVAEEYASLMRSLWSDRCHSSLRPAGFKRMLGRLNPQFDGYAQQDCQEFLAFLMDGLHEDLNRVKVGIVCMQYHTYAQPRVIHVDNAAS